MPSRPQVSLLSLLYHALGQESGISNDTSRDKDDGGVWLCYTRVGRRVGGGKAGVRPERGGLQAIPGFGHSAGLPRQSACLPPFPPISPARGGAFCSPRRLIGYRPSPGFARAGGTVCRFPPHARACQVQLGPRMSPQAVARSLGEQRLLVFSGLGQCTVFFRVCGHRAPTGPLERPTTGQPQP
jgi:hypothetical protein